LFKCVYASLFINEHITHQLSSFKKFRHSADYLRHLNWWNTEIL